MKELVEGAMSLYNTIELETNNTENKYTTGEDKIKEVLGNEEPLFIQEEDKVAAVDLMRKNLLMRNNEVGTYTLSYTTPGQTLDINDCSVEALFAIDGDMNPQSI